MLQVSVWYSAILILNYITLKLNDVTLLEKLFDYFIIYSVKFVHIYRKFIAHEHVLLR